MPKIDFDTWRGETPRYSRTEAPDGFASCAVNTKLWHGVLSAFACPKVRCEADADIGTMVEGCPDCFTFPEKLDVAKGFCGRDFITGREYPEMTHDICADDWCRLGVPCPPNAPRVTASGSCAGQTSQFVYRYVNKFGDVGPPSLLSNASNIDGSGGMNGIVLPDASWCITHVDVFGSISGSKLGNEATTNTSTAMLFLGRHVLANSIAISTRMSSAGQELDSLDNFPPPASLRGIVVTEAGLAGYQGHNVWYTKPNQPSAWPNKICLDFPVRAIHYWNNNLFVFTTKYLYRFSESIGDDGYEFSDPFVYGNKIVPLLAGRRSIASGQSGVFFPSSHGIMRATRDRVECISTEIFAKDDWCRISPSSMVAAYTDYGYMFFNDTVSYMIEVPDGTFDAKELNNYRVSFHADTVMVDNSGTLHYSDGPIWYTWDHCRGIKKTFKCGEDGRCICADCCSYYYKSTDMRFEQEERLTDGVIVFDGSHGTVELTVVDSGCHDRVLYKGLFSVNTDDCGNIQCDRKYFVLPSCSMVGTVHVILEGCAEVRRVSLGTSRSAL